jgi:hypothetical protein
MLPLRNPLALAATMLAIAALAGGTANAEETCVTARSSAGPMLIEAKAFSRANDRLQTAARNAEAQIRRAHAANGFVAGAVRYGRIAINCFRPDPLKFRKKCEGTQQVCVSYTRTQTCPPNQYFSPAVRRCVTLH